MTSTPWILATLLVTVLASRGSAAGVKVLDVTGEVELSPGGDDTLAFALTGGETVNEADRIVTGMESQARLQFADNSTVVVGELTDMKVALFNDAGGAIQTRLWLRGGEVSASVNKSVDRPSDFTVKTPTATAGVRGTRKRVFTALDRTQIAILSGSGFGVDPSGTTRTIDAGEMSETDEQGNLQTPDRTRREEARTDGSAGEKSFDENDAYQESSSMDVLTPGFSNTLGANTQQEEVVPDFGAVMEEVVPPAAGGSANLLIDGGFDGGNAWSVSNGVITGGAASGAVSPGNDFSVGQAFSFPVAGTYMFSADVNVAAFSGSDGVDIMFGLGDSSATFSSGLPFVSIKVPDGTSYNQTFSDTITVGGSPLDNSINIQVLSSPGIGSNASVTVDNVSIFPSDGGRTVPGGLNVAAGDGGAPN